MSQFNRIRIGKAGTPQDTTNRPSQDNNVMGTYEYPPVQGAPITPSYAQNLVPLIKNAANIAALQTPTGAGSLTLTAGTGSTAATIQGNSVIALDCARCIAIVGQAGVVQRSYTITGYDRYQQPMTQTLTGPNGAQTINTTKAFAYVQSITITGGTTNAISVGTSDIIGFDVAAPYYEALTGVNYNGAAVTSNANITVADATTPATATTGDVRGTINLGAISATDSAKRLVAETQLFNTDTVTQIWGVTQV